MEQRHLSQTELAMTKAIAILDGYTEYVVRIDIDDTFVPKSGKLQIRYETDDGPRIGSIPLTDRSYSAFMDWVNLSITESRNLTSEQK